MGGVEIALTVDEVEKPEELDAEQGEDGDTELVHCDVGADGPAVAALDMF